MATRESPEQSSLAHFRTHGWMRVARAFDDDAAQRMRRAVWRALSGLGVDPKEPSSWTVERPAHLKHLRKDEAFAAVGSAALIAAIDRIFEGRPYPMPGDWGALFIAFPSDAPWSIPIRGWHADAHYASALWPTNGVKTLAVFGDVEPRGGGTLIVSGSHRLIHAWFQANPPVPGAHGFDLRRELRKQPYIRELHRAGEPGDRAARFMDRTEEAGGIPLRVVELTGHAGDVFLLHPLVLHVAASNNASVPRFLLSGGTTTDMWGFSAAQTA
jgi:hypothetical protein